MGEEDSAQRQSTVTCNAIFSDRLKGLFFHILPVCPRVHIDCFLSKSLTSPMIIIILHVDQLLKRSRKPLHLCN